ncbi:hypothetical protein [Palleronia sediminis]|nr:hypothetical protein [Palleronia sediminis]
MRIITFFSPKNGAGRTTTLMTLASEIVSASKDLMLLDVPRQPFAAPEPFYSPLKAWGKLVANSWVGEGVVQTRIVGDMDGLLEATNHAADKGFEYILVDTPAQTYDFIGNVLALSDLIVVPATGTLEAALASDWFRQHPDLAENAFGLVTGILDTTEEKLTPAAFHSIPILQTRLPRCEAYRRQQKEGHLYELAVERRRFGMTEDERAIAGALELYMEIEALLTGNRPETDYLSARPLAADSPMAHLRVLLEQNSAFSK